MTSDPVGNLIATARRDNDVKRAQLAELADHRATVATLTIHIEQAHAALKWANRAITPPAVPATCAGCPARHEPTST